MKIGFIGTGNMGSAIIRGMTLSKFVPNENINIFDLDKNKLENLVKEYGVKTKNSEEEVAKNSDILILSVKPNIIPVVLEKIKKSITDKIIILSVAAGINIEFIENKIGANKKIVRIMSNTPAQVLQAMTAVSFNKNIINEEKEIIFKLLNSFGKSIELQESLMHAYTGISGSLPAYVYMFIEALADGGVLEGIPRHMTYDIISQTILGSAQTVLETKKHPAVLKDEVTSPAGTTIEAIKVLENNNFRGSIIEAVRVCSEKSKKIKF